MYLWGAGAARARIVDGFQPRRIILYGSHARGDARPFSDVDLPVLFDELDNPRKKPLHLYLAVSGCGLPEDIVVSTASPFERYKDVANTIYSPAAQEDRVVCERTAWPEAGNRRDDAPLGAQSGQRSAGTRTDDRFGRRLPI